MINTVAGIKHWFEKAVPEPKSKNFHTQLGVHFEEVCEIFDTIDSSDLQTNHLLNSAADALNNLAKHLKTNDNVITITDQVEFIDSICDQIVTGIGSCHMAGLPVVEPIDEVNKSNWSKFDDLGNPIFDENQKIIKGPNYFKPDISKFLLK